MTGIKDFIKRLSLSDSDNQANAQTDRDETDASRQADIPMEDGSGTIEVTTYEAYRALPDKKENTLYACLDAAKGKITRAYVGSYPFLCTEGESVAGYKVSVGINPSDLQHVARIEANGDVIDTQISATKDSYVFTITKGGSCTLNIIPAEGYLVDRLNVDTVSQGAVNTFTFSNILSDHTAYVWMKAAELPEEPVVDFLQRSDNNQVYSSLHLCLKEIKADYPAGLDKDLCITCVKKTTETRNHQDPDKLVSERLFVATMKDWNRKTIHTLTIDGAGLYTVNGNSLGGICFENVDNVIIKNISFTDFANHVKYGVPEELAAIMFTGEDGSYASNLYVTGCSFNGIYNEGGSYFSIVTKLTNNVYITGNTFSNNSGLTFKLTDTKLISLTGNVISGKQRSGITGHPGIFSNSGTTALYIEDNKVNGATFNEVLFYIGNTENIYIRRNEFYGAIGRVMEVSSNSQVGEFIFEANLLHDNMSTPIFPWIMDLVSLVCDTGKCEFRNNTVYFNGSLYRQWFVRASANYCNRLVNCNNIFIEATAANTVSSVFAFKGVGEYVAKSNLYKSLLKDDSPTRFYSMQLLNSENPDANPAYLTIAGNDARDMAYYTGKGYETYSSALAKTVKILDIESGGPTYGLIASIANTYLADPSNLTEFDLNYKQNVVMSSIGAINHNGVSWDETTDTTAGYRGVNTQSKVTFDEQSEYIVPSDDIITLCSKTKNRRAFVRFYLKGSAESYIGLGRNSLFIPVCLLKADATYDNIQTYNVEIEKV